MRRDDDGRRALASPLAPRPSRRDDEGRAEPVGDEDGSKAFHGSGMLPTVYILTNRPHGTLYIGVTGNPEARITQHRTGKGSAFAHRYNLHRLVYVEHFITMACAIRREKQLKAWRRAWKIALIERTNPEWKDLWAWE